MCACTWRKKGGGEELKRYPGITVYVATAFYLFSHFLNKGGIIRHVGYLGLGIAVSLWMHG